MEAEHRIAQYSVQIEVEQENLVSEKRKEKELQDQLIAAHKMNRVMQFFKRIRLPQLETNFAEVNSSVRKREQKHADLQRDLQHEQAIYDTSKQEERCIQAFLQELEDQLAMPTVQQKRIAQLKEQQRAYQSRRASLDASYAQDVQEHQLQQQQKILNDQRTQYTQQLAVIDQKLRDIEKNIVENAIVVGTTLSKTYMNQTIADRRFDVVILDEVSIDPIAFPQTRQTTFHSLTTMIDSKKRRSDNVDIRHFTATSSEDPAAFPQTGQNTFHSLTTMIDTKKRNSDYVDIKHLTDENFYSALLQDIQDAQSSIVIASAFAASKRVNKLLPYLDEKQKKGIKVKIFSRGDGDKWHIEGVKTIRESGIEMINREKLHEKIIVIDENILYHGSLNALSQNDTTESMLRILNHRIVREVSEYIQSEKLYESKQSKGLDLSQAVLEKLEKITLSVKKLPPCPGVCNCGGSFVQKYSAKNGSAFYGCSLFSSSPSMKHTIINPSLSSLGEIRELQDQLCTCGNSMSLNLQDWPQQRVLLVCNHGSCGRMKRVIFTR